MDQIWPWVGFNAFVLALLAVDLGVFHRQAHVVSIKEAAGWSVVWITLALYFLFAGVIHRFHFLKLGLSVVLVFVGAKMLLTDIHKVPIGVSLGVIALVLATSVVASLAFPKAVLAHDPVEHDPLHPLDSRDAVHDAVPDPADAPSAEGRASGAA